MLDSDFALINLIKYLKIYKCSENTLCKEAVQRKLVKIYIIYKLMRIEEKKRDSRIKRRRFWVRPIFNIERRFAQGASNNLMQEMTFEDVEKFFNYFRMTPETFEKLLHIVSPHIQKQFVIREPISARTRLQICLRYLSSGDSMVSISYAFRVGHNTVSQIVSETCDVIWDILKDMVFLKATEDNWRKIADEFEEKCNFPNCIGAIDGKHIILQVNF
ncbi:uncharacterized protein [Linepithema humile]|uniref:uncharacterized protein n=1 Tax=Linepithema humile TaxID=83485 RepID=UPI00351E7E39